MEIRQEPILIRELKTGSVKAFNEIYELYARRLYGFCLKYAKSRDIVEEIVSDTFVWVWNNRDNIRQDQSLQAIIFIKAKHLLINAYRKILHSPVYEDYMDYLDKSVACERSDGNIEYDDFVRHVNEILDKLPTTQREIVRLSKLEMMSNKEIAAKLNYSEQTVKNQLSLGLKALKKMLGYTNCTIFIIFFGC
ncbi:MAG: RNA polymerase sigma factor [Prevotella sp.]